MISKREIVFIILIGVCFELSKWASELIVSDENLFTAIYDSINVSMFSTTFIVLVLFKFRCSITWLALLNNFFRYVNSFNDVIDVDKYDKFLEVIHLCIISRIIYECIIYLKLKRKLIKLIATFKKVKQCKVK